MHCIHSRWYNTSLMADTERIILHRKFCIIRTQPMDEVIAEGRMMFRALGPCPMWDEPDTRTGIICDVRRSATVFSRWHLTLPDKHVLVTRHMMGIS